MWKKDLKVHPDDEHENENEPPETPGLGIAGACAAAASWWSQRNVPRPWGDPPKKSPAVAVPEEQTEGWMLTRTVCSFLLPPSLVLDLYMHSV